MLQAYWEPGVLQGSRDQQVRVLGWHRARIVGQLQLDGLFPEERRILAEMLERTDEKLSQLTA